MALAAEPLRRFDLGLSWRAIFVGLVVGLSAQFLLTLLGIAIGLSSLDLTGADVNVRGVGLGAAVWSLAVPIAAWFLGAYVASYVSGISDRRVGLLHGLSTWALGLLVFLFLLGTGLSGALSSSSGTIGAAAQTLSRAGLVRGDAFSDLQGGNLQGQAQKRLNRMDAQEVQHATHEIAKGAWAAFATGLLSLGAACLGGVAGGERVYAHFGARDRADRKPPLQPPLVPRPRTT
jgi:hypothetical protein